MKKDRYFESMIEVGKGREPERQWGRWRYDVPLLLAYVLIVLAVVRGLGLNNMELILERYWQFLDLEVLREKPYRSLLYLNSQPPLLNFIAWVLQSAPGSLYGNFMVLNAVCMSLVGRFTYIFSCRFLPQRWAFVAAVAYLVSPAVLLNIGYPFYPCLTALGYALLLNAFHLAATRRTWSVFFLLLAIAYLSMLRNSFSILHALFFAGVYIALNHRVMTTKLKWAVVLSAVVFSSAVPLKNLSLYGFFSASSWTPMNLARGIKVAVPLDYFSTPAEIRAAFPDLKCTRVYGVQDSEDVKRNGYINYNSCIFIEYVRMTRDYMADKYNFATHLTEIGHNIAKYLSPPDRYWGLLNRPTLLGYSEFVDRYVFLSVVWPKTNMMRLMVVAVLGFSSFIFWRSRNVFLGCCLLFVVVHFFSHVLTDGIESERFVFDIEFIFFVLFAACLGFVRGLCRQHAGRGKRGAAEHIG